jgi:hypothetical protein
LAKRNQIGIRKLKITFATVWLLIVLYVTFFKLRIVTMATFCLTSRATLYILISDFCSQMLQARESNLKLYHLN